MTSLFDERVCLVCDAKIAPFDGGPLESGNWLCGACWDKAHETGKYHPDSIPLASEHDCRHHYGAWNESNVTFCYKCGAIKPEPYSNLDPDPDQIPCDMVGHAWRWDVESETTRCLVCGVECKDGSANWENGNQQ